ncbi:MAG: HEAT repeat domain-containing protein [Planctomycetaceae bacterium]
MRKVMGMVLIGLAGCAGVESDIRRAEFRDSVLDIFLGSDRGLGAYVKAIGDSTTKPTGRERYQYVGTQHLASYRVVWALRGLGATRLSSAAELSNAVDRILYVLAHDPVPAVRGAACRELGRIGLRLPLLAGEPPPEDPRAAGNINIAAKDLAVLNLRIEQGEQVPAESVVRELESLVQETPPDLLSALQMVRAVAARPVSGSSGSVAEAAERLVPDLVRRCLLVALRDVACGDAAAPEPAPDPSPLVRLEAAQVLTRLASPWARESALRRLVDRLDPAEIAPDVRRALLAFLGEVGNPDAFEVCLRRLEDVDSGVRYHAAAALQRMTGAVGLAPEAAAWSRWREEHPEWKAPATETTTKGA